MTDAPSAIRQIHSCAPLFFVADVVKAAAYYEDALGFRSARLWGDPPVFAIPSRDDVRIMLSKVNDRALICPNGAQEESLDAYLWVRDADALFDEVKARGADIVFAPVDRNAYGMREFAVRDLDGYVLVFAHDIGAG